MSRLSPLFAAWVCLVLMASPARPTTDLPQTPIIDYDQPPKPIRLTKPQYPREAFDKQIEGQVVLEILINASGRVERARVVESVPLLDEAALKTVYEWTFEPARKNGKPVPTIARAPVAFRIFDPPKHPTEYAGEDSVIEMDHETVRFEDDGTGSRTEGLRVKVLTEAGVRRWGELVESYDTAFERFEFRGVRVTKPGRGTVATPLSAAVETTPRVLALFPVYGSVRESRLSVSDLRPGDTLDYEAIWTVHTPLAPGQFSYFTSFHHADVALDESLEIDVPRGRALKFESAAVPSVSEEGTRRVYRLTHSAAQRDEVEKARKLARRRSSRPRPDVALSTFPSWEAFGAWYQGLEADRRLPTPPVRAKAAELTAGLTTDREKVQAIYDYVSTQVRYVSLSLGHGAVQPHPAAETLANGYGDCKDKHTLLAALLFSVGLEADAALVSGSRETVEAVPYLQFDHMVSAVHVGPDIVWLDSTPEVAPFGWLSPDLRGRQTLLVPPQGPARLFRTPAEPTSPSEGLSEFRGSVDPSGTLTAHWHQSYRGDLEVPLRLALRVLPHDLWTEALEKRLRQLAESRGETAQATGIRSSDPGSTREAFTIDADYTASRLVDFTARSPALRVPFDFYQGSEAADLKLAEDGSLRIGGPFTMRWRATIELPPGWSAPPPPPVEIATDFAEYRAHYASEGRTLTVERSLTVKLDALPQDRGKEYDDVRAKITAEERAALRLVTAHEGQASAAPAEPAPGLPVKVGGAIKEPRKLKEVPPVYPELAREARVQGPVVLEATISPEGNVTHVKVLKGIPLLDDAAVEAVKQWVYTPTLVEDRPVPVIMTVTVNFKLSGLGGPADAQSNGPRPSTAAPERDASAPSEAQRATGGLTLGVRARWLGEKERSQLAGPAPTGGLIVHFVYARGPGARAGLRYDDVITSVDGTAVKSEPELSAALQGHAAGQSARLDVWRDGRMLSVTVDLAEAVPLFRNGCEAGEVQACTTLGRRHERGNGVPRDQARAAELYQKGCDGGDLEGCVALGWMYGNGKGVDKDEGRAAALFSRGCDSGEAQGCMELSYLVESGRGVAKDPARAAELAERGCEGGSPRGCTHLGWMYQNGTGVDKDERRAAALYLLSCDAGDSRGCTNAGGLFEQGKGVPTDEARAIAFYQKACDARDAHGCTSLGTMYGRGRGVVRDEARAASLYEKGCEGGHARGCTNLGWHYQNGRGVPQDEKRAAALYKRGCDGGDDLACSRVSRPPAAH